MITISKKGVANGDPLQLINLCYLLNKDQMVSEFNKVGIKIVCDDENIAAKSLMALSKLCASKVDVGGKIIYNDRPIVFDTMRIVETINKGREYIQSDIDLVKQNTVE